MSKRCKTCRQVKPLTAFYKHPSCPNGLGSCKTCRVKYVSGWYQENKESRKKYRRQYGLANPEKERLWQLTARRNTYRRHPQRVRARNAVYTAKRTGRLSEKPCEVCGDRPTECHHDDYSKPLQVRWLCRKHHKALHQSKGK